MKKHLLTILIPICLCSGCGGLAEDSSLQNSANETEPLFEIIQQSIKESNTYDLADKYLSVQFIYDDAFERYQANITFNRELFALENYTKILYKDETVERIFQEIYPNIYTGVAALDILNFISWEIPDLNTAKKGENVTLHWVIKEELLNKYFSGHYNPISITYVVTD